MSLNEFQQFIKNHEQRFVGVHPETAESLEQFELLLGFTLPATLKWLLGTFGYTSECGVDNLEESVRQTLACRDSISLPSNWLLLNDWGDAGIVLLNLESGRICYCGSFEIDNVIAGMPGQDQDWFDGYPEWVFHRMQE